MSIEAQNLNSFIIGTLIVHTQRMNKNMEGGRYTTRSFQGLVIYILLRNVISCPATTLPRVKYFQKPTNMGK